MYIIDNCRVVQEDSGIITVEIELLEHNHLMEDITRKFFTKKISTRKFEKKNNNNNNHAYIVGNPFLTLKIYSGL